uniref:Fucolectin tachylectin-4 pentraxin-1 domain-containing protein n=1 Tax=Cyclopterus lumpus TaxID=8103 RepID=A0A8C3AD65_CYCLU
MAVCACRSQLFPGCRRATRMTSPAAVFVLLVVLGQTSVLLGANIAKGGKVTQSSVGWAGVPERAVDGKRANRYAQGSCSHTRRETTPWWRLDLLKTFTIKTVTVTNRRDCCHDRINGAEIRIGNSLDANGNDNPKCAVVSSMAAGASKTFACNGMEGRYVTVVIPGRQKILTLCEVEVTGTETGDSGQNVCG